MSGVAIFGLAALSAWLAINIAICGSGGDCEPALTKRVNSSKADADDPTLSTVLSWRLRRMT
jgi:hypothetical protein